MLILAFAERDLVNAAGTFGLWGLNQVHSVFFISNTVNSQPISDFRFSIVVACDCCLVSKKKLITVAYFPRK